jgi:hypothetical protein
MAIINQRRALELIRDQRRCAVMNTPDGEKWFLVPGGQVTIETAEKIKRMPQVAPSYDALFPNMSQTWRWT